MSKRGAELEELLAAEIAAMRWIEAAVGRRFAVLDRHTPRPGNRT